MSTSRQLCTHRTGMDAGRPAWACSRACGAAAGFFWAVVGAVSVPFRSVVMCRSSVAKKFYGSFLEV